MRTEIVGDFEWDSAKATANLRKHRVSFMEAVRAFLDPFAVDLRDNGTTVIPTDSSCSG